MNFEGVEGNECLMNIRKTVWNSDFTEKTDLLALCNGDFDYHCPMKNNLAIGNNDRLNDVVMNQQIFAGVTFNLSMIISIVLLSLVLVFLSLCSYYKCQRRKSQKISDEEWEYKLLHCEYGSNYGSVL